MWETPVPCWIWNDWISIHSLYQHHGNLGTFPKWYVKACNTQQLHPFRSEFFHRVITAPKNRRQVCCWNLLKLTHKKILWKFGKSKKSVLEFGKLDKVLQSSCVDLSSNNFCTKNSWFVNTSSLINIRNLIEISKNNCKLCKEIKGMTYYSSCRKLQGHYGSLLIFLVGHFWIASSNISIFQAGSSLGDDHFKQISRGHWKIGQAYTCFVDHGDLV